MSLSITFGRKGMLLQEDQHASFLVRFPSPVATEAQWQWLLHHPEFTTQSLPCLWSPQNEGPAGLESSVRDLCVAAERAVDAGTRCVLQVPLPAHGTP